MFFVIDQQGPRQLLLRKGCNKREKRELQASIPQIKWIPIFIVTKNNQTVAPTIDPRRMPYRASM